MKNIQKILNAVLSKNAFEYLLIDKDLFVVSCSDGIEQYVGMKPEKGDDSLFFMPEFVGSESEIKKIFTNATFLYALDSIHKEEFYVNITVEHFDEDTALVLLHNITDVTFTQQKLLQYSNESILLNNTLQKILNRQNALVFVTHNDEISYTNDQFLEYFNVQKVSDIRRKNLQFYKYLDTSFKSYTELFERVNDKEEYVLIDNDTFILQATEIEGTHKLFTLTKITKLSKEMEIDSLTGVYKKSYFNKRLEKITRENESAILVVIDIDDFKNVNDTYGHQVGDVVLREFATLINQNIRGEDIFARWGGEEFLLLLQGTNIENAMKKIEKLRSLIDTYSFEHIAYMTASFGITERDEDDDIHTVLQRADKALYEAKDAGKNRLVFKKL